MMRESFLDLHNRKQRRSAHAEIFARCALAAFVALLAFVLVAPASAHPVPFSYLDLDVHDDRIDGTLTVHASDFAHEFGLDDPAGLLDPDTAPGLMPRMVATVEPGLVIGAGEPLALDWTGVSPSPDDTEAVRLSFRIAEVPADELQVSTDLFPYDPQHQTFVNLREDGELRQQWILSGSSGAKTYYRGTTAGVFAVMRTFVPSGVHHILIGPDHLMFLAGLILMGGGFWALVRVVTAFTIGHSITLALATLDIVTLPPALVEPLIALSIIIVGVDNLLKKDGRDLRAPLALAFGLIHGFGFAGVLQEFGLPQEALGWSLFSFNVGVELGQLAVVVPFALALAFLKSRSPAIHRRVAIGGSIVVIGAGTYWFFQRVFQSGGI